MKHFFFYSTGIALLTLLVFSCRKKEEQKEDASLTYSMEIFRLESSGGCQVDTSKCASYEIVYPVFSSLPAIVLDSLKRRIAEAVDTGNPEIDTLSIENSGQKFIADFEKVKMEFPAGALGWYYKGSVSINLLTDTLISLESNTEYFTGGAHGGYGIYFININPSSGEAVTLSDILKPGYEEPLRKIAETEFRKSLHLDDTTSFADGDFEFPNGKFTLNSNYGFTKDGIAFVFNIYEIGPYVAGAPMFLVPYQKIKDILK